MMSDFFIEKREQNTHNNKCGNEMLPWGEGLWNTRETRLHRVRKKILQLANFSWQIVGNPR